MNSLLKVIAIVTLISLVSSECTEENYKICGLKTLDCLDPCISDECSADSFFTCKKCIECFGDLYETCKKCIEEGVKKEAQSLNFLESCLEVNDKCSFDSDCCSKRCWSTGDVCMPKDGWSSGHQCDFDSDCNSKKCDIDTYTCK